MKTYVSKENPNVSVISNGEIDPKYKTVEIIYPDGKSRMISASTLHNHWEEKEELEDFALPFC